MKSNWFDMIIKIEESETYQLADLRALDTEREKMRLLEHDLEIRKIVEYNNDRIPFGGPMLSM